MSSVVYDSLVEGRYQLLEVIGEGGMATVYRAFDQRLRRTLAIKVLAPALSNRRSIRERFLGEARAMASLHDRRVVRVIDYGEDGDRAYIIMELVDGGSLLDRVRDYGPLPPRMAALVTLELCGVLDQAHEQGIIHRDIKPHNVLLTRTGEIRVTDFGVAQVRDQEGDAMTRTGAVMGTWGFMAPEQKSNAKHVDARADIYSVGATLWALLRGETPPELFMADSETEMLEGIPDELAEIVRRATRYRKEERYRTCREMGDSIGALLALLPDDPSDSVPLIPPPPNRHGADSHVSTIVQLGTEPPGPPPSSPPSGAARTPPVAARPRAREADRAGTLIPTVAEREAALVEETDSDLSDPSPETGLTMFPSSRPDFSAPPGQTDPHGVPPQGGPSRGAAGGDVLINATPGYTPPLGGGLDAPPPLPEGAPGWRRWALLVGLAVIAGVIVGGVLVMLPGPPADAPVDAGAPPPEQPALPLVPGADPSAAKPPTGAAGSPDLAAASTTPSTPPSTPPSAAPPTSPPVASPGPSPAAPTTGPTAPATPGTTAGSPTPRSTPTAPSAPPDTTATLKVEPVTTETIGLAPKLIHDPPSSVPLGGTLTFAATIAPDCTVKLYWRPTGSAPFQEKRMVPEGERYAAALTVEEEMKGGIEYFIEASCDGIKQYTGRYNSPLRISPS